MDVYSVDVTVEGSYPTPYANTTLLTALLMSLAMQKHTPDTKKDFSEEYDYVIVGGGTAGAVVANRLSELPENKVLLLESGGSPPILTDVPALARHFWLTDIDWGYRTTPQKNTASALKDRRVPLYQGKAMGGSTVLNEMMYVRGNRKNYDDWAAQGATGWSYDEVLPYFLKLEENWDTSNLDAGFHSIRGPVSIERPKYDSELHNPITETIKHDLNYKILDSNGKNQTGFYDLQATTRNGQRCSSAKAYLVPAERRANLHILKNAHVTKILIKEGIAYGVQLDFGGKKREVKAKKEVILSAGAINTAQLLMLSGIGPKNHLEQLGIETYADLPVGSNLQIQPGIPLIFHVDIPEIYDKLKDHKHVESYERKREGPLASPLNIIYLGFVNGLTPPPDVDDPQQELVIEEYSTEVAKRYLGLIPGVYDDVYGRHEGKPMYACKAYVLQPKSRGTVTLSSTDPYAQPNIDPNFFSDPNDLLNIIQGYKVCKAIGHSEHMKKVGSTLLNAHYPGCEDHLDDDDKYCECLVRSVILTNHHPVGTTKMGNPDDPTTVVDPELKVKGVKHLRVVDGSVMPTTTSGNNNIPIMMIAEKASDMITGRKPAVASDITEIKQAFEADAGLMKPTTNEQIVSINGEVLEASSFAEVDVSLEESTLEESSFGESAFEEPFEETMFQGVAFSEMDYEESDYEVTDYEETDYKETDYEETEFEESDGNKYRFINF